LIELVISFEKENEKLKTKSETTYSNSEKLLLMPLDLLIDEKIKGINDKISIISNDLYAYIDKSINGNTEE
jgi:inner membrane protein involved in colicin E2 resistance